MTHGFLTVVIPFASARAGAVNAALAQVGNVTRGAVKDELDAGAFVHFMSMVVVCEESDAQAHLVLEASVDGSPRTAMQRMGSTMRATLHAILRAAGEEVAEGRLDAYLERHMVEVGTGWFSPLGLVFSGTPGMSVERIKNEARLAHWIQNWLENHDVPRISPLEKLERVRHAIFANEWLKWAFLVEPIPPNADKPEDLSLWKVTFSIMRLYWPLILLPGLFVLAGVWSGPTIDLANEHFRYFTCGVLGSAIAGALLGFLAYRIDLGGFRALMAGAAIGALFGGLIAVVVPFFDAIDLGTPLGALLGVALAAVLFRNGPAILALAVLGAVTGMLIGVVLGSVPDFIPGPVWGAGWGAPCAVLLALYSGRRTLRKASDFLLAIFLAAAAGAILGALASALFGTLWSDTHNLRWQAFSGIVLAGLLGAFAGGAGVGTRGAILTGALAGIVIGVFGHALFIVTFFDDAGGAATHATFTGMGLAAFLAALVAIALFATFYRSGWPALALAVLSAIAGGLAGAASGLVLHPLHGLAWGALCVVLLARYLENPSLPSVPDIFLGVFLAATAGAILGGFAGAHVRPVWPGTHNVLWQALWGMLLTGLLGYIALAERFGWGRAVLAGALAGIVIGVFGHAFFIFMGLLVTFVLAGLGGAVGAILGGILLGAEVVAVLLFLGFAYVVLRAKEQADTPQDVEPEAQEVAEIMALENQAMQNHLAGVSVMKRGWVRKLALRLAFWAIGEFGRYTSPPGTLSGIGTIHFARWVLLPGSDKLVFLSNYDGSWVSYLEDFIARAHRGLTAIWSNTRDFPRTRGLREEGASDGDRFKRWARRQQRPTRFWYSAYPDLTTARIRINARISHGFATASTDTEAAKWLELFQYRAPETVETDEVPTLVFGGLAGLNYGHCLVAQLGAGRHALHALHPTTPYRQVRAARLVRPARTLRATRVARMARLARTARAAKRAGPRAWLGEIAPDICYGERFPSPSALAAAFSATGLRKLGVGESALASFPTAFQHGMAAPWRAQALGDTGRDDPSNWWWGGSDRRKQADAVLVLYAMTDRKLRSEIALRTRQLQAFGHRVVREIPLRKVPSRTDPDPHVREPFGFRDGISQPIMRGSRNWVKDRNPIHVVEPGELVLGYPDNLGKVAPTPRIGGHDLGRNGTFLVVRQLEQDIDGFRRFIAETARRLAGDPRLPNSDVEEWLQAKMVGRWKNGSSLVKNPYYPAKKSADGKDPEPDNDFLFGTEDKDGLRCPFGAHIRRANPRDSFEPGSNTQIAITNRHRIFRVGRTYVPPRGSPPGLLFMCVNADIEGQFEFLQQTWVLGSRFHGLEDEIDPLVGHRDRGEEEIMTIPTASRPLRVRGMRDFVTMRGGGYFFMPGRAACTLLAR